MVTEDSKNEKRDYDARNESKTEYDTEDHSGQLCETEASHVSTDVDRAEGLSNECELVEDEGLRRFAESVVSLHSQEIKWDYRIPPPQIFNEYNPEAQRALLAMCDRESVTDCENQTRLNAAIANDSRRTSYLSFASLVILIGLTAFLYLNGHNAAAFISLTTLIALPLVNQIGDHVKRDNPRTSKKK